jgi:hypothetical protein
VANNTQTNLKQATTLVKNCPRNSRLRIKETWSGMMVDSGADVCL